MRRRKKPVANESESTGKIGHEIPRGQPAPLQPSYLQPAETPAAPAGSRRSGRDANRPDSADGTPGAADEPGAAPRQARTQARTGAQTQAQTGDEPPDEGQGRRAERGGGRGGRPGSRRRSRGGRGGGSRTGGSRAGDSRKTDSAAASSAGEAEDLALETGPEPGALPSGLPDANRPVQGTVVLAIGLPGSGKTTWFKRRGVTPLSSDMLRALLFDDIAEQRQQGLVFSTLRSLLRARLIAKMPSNYVDATNLSFHERRQWIKMARGFGYEVHAVFFDVPFEVCMERNRRRDRMVSEEAMAKMQERLRPPSFKEGFHKITAVRVKNTAPGEPAQELASEA